VKDAISGIELLLDVLGPVPSLPSIRADSLVADAQEGGEVSHKVGGEVPVGFGWLAYTASHSHAQGDGGSEVLCKATREIGINAPQHLSVQGGMQRSLQARTHMPVRFSIVTGKGKHSRGEGPVVKPAIESLLRARGVRYHVLPHNDGCLSVPWPLEAEIRQRETVEVGQRESVEAEMCEIREGRLTFPSSNPLQSPNLSTSNDERID